MTCSVVNHRLPLLKLPEDVLEALRAGKIEYTKAREVASLKDPIARAALLEEVIANGLSRQALKARRQELEPARLRPDPGLLSRVVNLGTLVRKSRALKTPTTRREVEALPGKLEAILADEA